MQEDFRLFSRASIEMNSRKGEDTVWRIKTKW